MRRPYGRRKHGDSLEPGQDAFLDVVANLVGILIILVVLIGSQAQTVWEQVLVNSEAIDEEVSQLDAKTESAETTTGRLTAENETLEKEINQQGLAAKRLEAERDQMLLAVKAVSETIEKRKTELSEQDKQQHEMSLVAEKLKNELDELASKSQSLESSESPTGIIEHLPTPIAKTVFGEEIHFRLRGGRLVHVPLNELVDRMRSEWKVKAKKLNQTPSTIETVGPVNDFRLQYKLVLKEQTQQTEYGVVRAMVPGLERFILLPTRENLGEPIQQAINPESNFMRFLGGLDPNEVTVSVWVYPDSFQYFNQIKSELSKRGFLCAGWPLPENQPISGSPDGFRTAAQ